MMEIKAIIILVVMVYQLSDAVPSDHNRALHRLPVDRKRLSLFPKITTKFIYTPPPEGKPKHITQLVPKPNNLTKKRLMPKIVPQYEKEKVIPSYKPPVTRNPLMKIQRFTLEPQSNENILKPNINRYDTIESNEKESEEESMAIKDNFESEEEYDEEQISDNETIENESEEEYDEEQINDNESIENVDNDNDESDIHPKNLQHREKNNVVISNLSKNDDNLDHNEITQNQTFLNDKNIEILDPSEKYESEEHFDVNDNGEILNDSEEKEDENEEEETSSENDEIFNISWLEVIEHITDNIMISNEETALKTESQLSKEETSDNTSLHDQSSFSTIEPYLPITVNKDIADHNAKTSVTKPMEKTTDEFIELYNIETNGPVMDKIRTRFKRNKRSVNIIEEENLGTTISGFKFTGREPLLSSHLAFKNINT